MPKHYITIPVVQEIERENIITGEKLDEAGWKNIECKTWGDLIRRLVLSKQMADALDLFERNEVRHKLTRAKPGEVVELDGKLLDALKAAFLAKEENVVPPSFAFAPGGITMLEALVSAPATDPRIASEKANGAATVAEA